MFSDPFARIRSFGKTTALARNPAACAAMYKHQAEEINPHSARDAVSHVLADLERRS